MKFLLQSEDSEIKNIEIWMAKRIIDEAPKIYDLSYEIKDIKDITEGEVRNNDIIPVGSIQFCEKALGGRMYPVEVPPIMRNNFNLGREYKIVRTNKIKSHTFCFIKRVDRLKSELTMRAITDEATKEFEGEIYQISEYVEFVAEYRIIVLGEEIVHIGWYNGQQGIFPDMEKVKLIVMQYVSVDGRAEAFTIDVGITKSNNTVLIEIHPFACCGTYGYSGFAGTEYLTALAKGWEYYKSEYNKLIEVDEDWENGGVKCEIAKVRNETIRVDSKLDWQFESIRKLAKSLNIEYSDKAENKKSKIEILDDYKRKNRLA